jgi:acyl-CoA thioesterase-1
MNAIALYFASGLTFFWGVPLLVAAATARLCLRKPALRAVRRLATVAGVLLVALSATPLPYPLYAFWGALAVALLLDPLPAPGAGRLRTLGLSAAIIVISIIAFAMELPYHITSRPVDMRGGPLFVIGDSITAGAGERVVTWPQLLERELAIRVADLSRPGETCLSALSKARRLEIAEPGEAVVLLEIGGNDMLGWTSVQQFRYDLDQLLAAASRPGARVYLMELPLPPLHNGYGAAQRALARKHGATLIPKHHFARILAAPGATTDGLHLSARGHQLMADALREILPLARVILL